MNKYKLTKEIKTYCRKFGIAKVRFANEFSYYPEKEMITYTIYIDEMDEELTDLIEEKYHIDIRPIYFVFALLHEVGHHMTLDDLTEEDLETDLLLRAMIPFFEEKGKAYLGFPAEDMSTSWSLYYILNNVDECFDFQNRCYQIMRG